MSMIINPVHERDLAEYRRGLNIAGIDFGYSHALDAYVLMKQIGGRRFAVMEARRSAINANMSGAFRLMETFIEHFRLKPTVQSYTLKSERFVPTSLGNLLSWNTHDDWDGVRWNRMNPPTMARTLAAFVELSWDGSPLMDQLVEIAPDETWRLFALMCAGNERLRRAAQNHPWAQAALAVPVEGPAPEPNDYNILLCEAHRMAVPARTH